MIIAGVVAEFNPFHNGHARLLSEARRRGDAVAVVMSGHVTQRGSLSLIDKWSRAHAALNAGADLVLELPAPWACASAEGFARGGVGLLRALGCSALAFGSESADPDFLLRAARALDDPAVNERIRAGVRAGLSFARARSDALGFSLEQPNDILAVEYIRAAGDGMEFWPIPRVGAAHNAALPENGVAGWTGACSPSEVSFDAGGHSRAAGVPMSPVLSDGQVGEGLSRAAGVPTSPDLSGGQMGEGLSRTAGVPTSPVPFDGQVGEGGGAASAFRRTFPGTDGGCAPRKGSEPQFASASALRELLLRGEDVSAFVPEGSIPPDALFCRPERLERAAHGRLRGQSPADWSILPDANDGLAGRMYRAAGGAGTLEELYRLAKTKRHALARVRRVALCGLLGLTAADRALPLPYLRVLGMGERAEQVLSEVRGRMALPLDTSLSRLRGLSPEAARCAALECAATDLFACGCEEIPPRGVDFTRKGVIIK